MDTFLREHPDYSREAAFLAKIKDKEIYAEVGRVDDHVTLIAVRALKKLARCEAYKSRAMRSALRKIAAREATGVEKLVYLLISGQVAEFDDIRTKILFYKEFWSFRKFFRNKTDSHSFIMAELLYLRVYFNKDTSRRVMSRLEQMSPLDRLFYFLVFSEYLDREYILGLSKAIDTMYLANTQVDYKVVVLSALSEDDFYASVSSYLLYAAPVEKIRIMRNLGGSVDFRRLVLVMLDECFSSKLAINKIYAEYLRLVGLFGLEHKFRLKLLYSWMRYFLVEGLLEQFRELAEKIGKTQSQDDEFEFYRQFVGFIDGKLSLQRIKARFEDFSDTNDCARHSFKQILDAYSGNGPVLSA